MSNNISQAVCNFIDENIPSVGRLRVLLLLRERAHEALTSGDVAAQLQVSTGEAQDHLAALTARGLAAVNQATPDAYHYAALPPAQAVLEHLCELDRERPVTLIKLIYARQRSR